VPVLLLYFTASVADGRLRFRPDLYNRDEPIIRTLSAPFRFAPVDTGTRSSRG
jgi:murein L,D-transpeptidase YcbB/YkuD